MLSACDFAFFAGLCGTSDVRVVVERAEGGDARAILGLDVYLEIARQVREVMAIPDAGSRGR